MKAVLMSIKPKWCEKIFNGEKTVEVRKTAPKLKPPFKVYVYESLGKKISCRKCAIWQNCPMRSPFGCNEGAGAVVGEFVCDKKECFVVGSLRCDEIEELACLSDQEMIEYFYKPEELDGKTVKAGTVLHTTAPKLYDTPKELSEFSRYGYMEIEHAGNGYVFCDNTQCGYCEPTEVIAGLYKPPVCRKGGCKITRPPQSFIYVEDEEQ